MRPTPSEIQSALDVLTAAGWAVRHDRTFGHLIGGTGIVAMSYGDPTARTFDAWTAKEPWQDVTP